MKCKRLFALLLSLCMIASTFIAVPVSAATETVVSIVVEDASDITWLNGGAAADADGIGGRDGVIELSNLANSNDNTAGVKLPDGFAFQAGDTLTYSVDVYSNGTQPDVWLRNQSGSLEPFTKFFHEVTANTWTTITKTITTEELEALNAAGTGAGTFTGISGNFALYFRPRNASKIYIDNFTVTVARELTGKPSIEKVDYVTDEGNGVYKCTTAGIVAEEQSGAWSSQVRLRIIPEVPVSINEDLKITFDFEAAGILNSIGTPYDVMTVNLRLYDSINGTNQAATIGYIKNAHVAANTGAPVTLEYYIADMENGGGTSSLTEVKSIGVQVDMNGACKGYQTEANDGYFTISNIQVGTGTKEDHEHTYSVWVEDGDNHKKSCSCGDVVTEAHTWNGGVVTVEPTTETEGVKTYTCTACGATKTEVLDKIEEEVDRATIVEIVVEDASDITWKNGGTAADADGIGGRDGVVELSNLANANGNTAGVKLADNFSFQAGDILTYSVDVYSNGTQPDLWLRNSAGNMEPFTTFYHEVPADTWTTITKTVEYKDFGGTGDWTTAGNFALYFRPRNASKIYIDNFTVTVARELTGKPTAKPTVDYMTDEGNGTYKLTTKDLYEKEAEGATSSQVRLRIIPEVPVSTSDSLKVTFDFKADEILNSIGNPYNNMSVNLRLYDSENGTTQGNTIGYIKNANAIANTGDAVTLEFYIEDMVNGGGTSTLTEIKSIGVQVDMYGAYKGYAAAANDGYFTISNISITDDKKADHTHGVIGCIPVEGGHSDICGCGYATTAEEHAWGEGVVTQEPTTEAEGVKTYTCSVCKGTKTETIDKLVDPMVITVGNATAKVGEEVTVAVNVEKNTGLAGLTLWIEYDDSALNLIGAVNGSVLEGFTPSSFTNKENPKKFVWDSMENSSKDGELLLLNFEVIENAQAGEYEVKVTEIVSSYAWADNNDFIDVPVTTVDGKVTVAPAYVLGDVNDDGKIRSDDIVLTRRYITGGWDVDINEKAADVDADTKHTAKDVILLRRKVAGGYDVGF